MANQEASDVLDRLGIKPSGSDLEDDVYLADAQYRAFGVSRQAWAGPPLLNLVLKTGLQRSLPYSQLVESEFHPADIITIRFFEKQVTIRGRGLAEAYQKLLAFRVVYFAEADHASVLLVPEEEPVVTSITIGDRQPDLGGAEAG